jgi:hypothetical protein
MNWLWAKRSCGGRIALLTKKLSGCGDRGGQRRPPVHGFSLLRGAPPHPSPLTSNPPVFTTHSGGIVVPTIERLLPYRSFQASASTMTLVV